MANLKKPLNGEKRFPSLDIDANIYAISDTHDEEQIEVLAIPSKVDCIVHAGDVVHHEKLFKKLDGFSLPVIIVLGNHDLWHQNLDYKNVIAKLKKIAKKYKNIFLLENEKVELGRIRFIGSTFWYNSYFGHPRLVLEAAHRLADCNNINAASWWRNPQNLSFAKKMYECLIHEVQRDAGVRGLKSPYETLEQLLRNKMFHPLIAYQLNHQALDFLTDELQKPFDGATFVVTHHPPTGEHLRRLHFYNSELDPNAWVDIPMMVGFPKRMHQHAIEPFELAAYSNPYENLFVRKERMRKNNNNFWYADGRLGSVDIWFYGHVHDNQDHGFQGTRFINNARQSPNWYEDDNVFNINDGLQADIDIAESFSSFRIQEIINKLLDYLDMEEIESIKTKQILALIALQFSNACHQVHTELLSFNTTFSRITGISALPRECDLIYQTATEVRLFAVNELSPRLPNFTLKQSTLKSAITLLENTKIFLQLREWCDLPRNFETLRKKLDIQGSNYQDSRVSELFHNQTIFDWVIEKNQEGDFIVGRSIERGVWTKPEKILCFDTYNRIGRTYKKTMFRVLGEPILEPYKL